LRELRRGRGIQVCPKCGSPQIESASWLDGWVFPNRYVCADCGYSGYIVMELEKEKGKGGRAG